MRLEENEEMRLEDIRLSTVVYVSGCIHVCFHVCFMYVCMSCERYTYDIIVTESSFHHHAHRVIISVCIYNDVRNSTCLMVVPPSLDTQILSAILTSHDQVIVRIVSCFKANLPTSNTFLAKIYFFKKTSFFGESRRNHVRGFCTLQSCHIIMRFMTT